MQGASPYGGLDRPLKSGLVQNQLIVSRLAMLAPRPHADARNGMVFGMEAQDV
jgi:hypothetical protein